jgi:uncharacterized Zn finger protein (UPF0148 family)
MGWDNGRDTLKIDSRKGDEKRNGKNGKDGNYETNGNGFENGTAAGGSGGGVGCVGDRRGGTIGEGGDMSESTKIYCERCGEGIWTRGPGEFHCPTCGHLIEVVDEEAAVVKAQIIAAKAAVKAKSEEADGEYWAAVAQVAGSTETALKFARAHSLSGTTRTMLGLWLFISLAGCVGLVMRGLVELGLISGVVVVMVWGVGKAACDAVDLAATTAVMTARAELRRK